MEACSYYRNPEKNNCIFNIPSAFVRNNLIYLQETGERQLSGVSVDKGENLDSCLFFIVTDGVGTLEYEQKTYMISVGYCAFLDCRIPYSCYSVQGTLKLKYIFFYGINIENIYNEYLRVGGVPCFRSYGPKVFTEVIEQINTIALSTSDVKDMEISEKLIYLLTMLTKAGENTGKWIRKSTQKRDVGEVKEYLEKNYWRKITLDGLSEMFCINKFYLIRLFNEQFGISVNDYLINVRIERAKILLCSSNISVENIGRDCGINNANYFSKIFKKREGISPGEFRKKKKSHNTLACSESGISDL